LFETITSNSNDDSVSVIVDLTGLDNSVTSFTFEASPAQAVEYEALSNVCVYPVESSAFTLILDLADFILLPTDPSECNKRLVNARKENLDVSMDEYFKASVSDFASRFRTCAVSLDGTSFSTSSNIAIDEVDKAVSFISTIQTQSFGIVKRLAPSLGSDSVLPVLSQFQGEISSYLSNRRGIYRLLLENYPVSYNNPLLNPCQQSTLEKISKKVCYIPTRHIALGCRDSSGENCVTFKLASSKQEKLNLLDRSITKENGRRILDVRKVFLTLNGVEFEAATKSKYNFVNESCVSPLMNAKTVRYAAGTAIVTDKGTHFKVSIPIRIHNDHTTTKSTEGYLVGDNPIDILKLS
jgi:hypothetical protein